MGNQISSASVSRRACLKTQEIGSSAARSEGRLIGALCRKSRETTAGVKKRERNGARFGIFRGAAERERTAVARRGGYRKTELSKTQRKLISRTAPHIRREERLSEDDKNTPEFEVD